MMEPVNQAVHRNGTMLENQYSKEHSSSCMEC